VASPRKTFAGIVVAARRTTTTEKPAVVLAIDGSSSGRCLAAVDGDATANYHLGSIVVVDESQRRIITSNHEVRSLRPVRVDAEQLDLPSDWLTPPAPPPRNHGEDTAINSPVRHDHYSSFAELRESEAEGIDYQRRTLRVESSSVAVIAPHGGKIEHHTSEIAAAIAGANHNLYVFEGIKANGSAMLHITSHRFDDPQCLELIKACDLVVAVHGCSGSDENILIGGLDDDMIAVIAAQLIADGFVVQTSGHKFPRKDPSNICNRGRRSKGVQLELTAAIRDDQRFNELAASMRQAIEKFSPKELPSRTTRG
jgi:phage replication-related protein YjqB (UPF0714/DUF867 family)